MKRTSILAVASALGMGLAQGPAMASEAAMAKLTECMKMKAATPEQQACLKTAESLRQPPAAAAAAATASASANANAKSTAAPPGVATIKSTAAAPPKVIQPPPEVKAAAATVHLNGPSPVPDRALSGIVVGDLKGLDPEAAMKAIQAQRATLLEGQLKGQIEGIQQRNSQIGLLNALLSDLMRLRPAGGDRDKWGNLGADRYQGKVMYDRVKAAGLTMPTGPDEVNESGTGIYDAKQRTFDQWDAQITGKIASMNATQQIDMQKMQSVTNKRNEAFDLMNNFLKKLADNLNHSAVLGNMR